MMMFTELEFEVPKIGKNGDEEKPSPFVKHVLSLPNGKQLELSRHNINLANLMVTLLNYGFINNEFFEKISSSIDSFDRFQSEAFVKDLKKNFLDYLYDKLYSLEGKNLFNFITNAINAMEDFINLDIYSENDKDYIHLLKTIRTIKRLRLNLCS